MIVSHAHRFIFLKPRKVAGTSIEVALAPFCGPQDILTPVTDFVPGVGHEVYEQPHRNDDGCYNHMLPREIARELDQRGQAAAWRGYRKVTVVRNPWDMLVSQFYWQQTYQPAVRGGRWEGLMRKLQRNLASSAHVRHVLRARWRRLLGKPSPRHDFGEFIRNLHPKFLNSRYYAAGHGVAGHPRGTKIPDLIIRYEHLQQDFDAVCTELGLPQQSLPRLKTGSRKNRAHYSTLSTHPKRVILWLTYAQQKLNCLGTCLSSLRSSTI